MSNEFSPVDPQPGVYEDVPMDVYHSARCLSRSALATLHEGVPADLQRYLQHGKRETEAMKFGTAVGMLLCEPERFADTYIERPAFGGENAPPEFRGTGAKQRIAAWKEANAHRKQLDPAAWELAHEVVRAVKAAPAAKRILALEDLKPEVSAVWRDTRTGVLLRTRPDWISEEARMTVDLKIASEGIQDHHLQSYVAKRYAHLQAAMNFAAWASVGVKLESHALIVACPSEYGVLVRVVVFSIHDTDAPNWLEAGHDLLETLVSEVAVLERTQDWYDWSDRGTSLEVPHFISYSLSRLHARRDAALSKLDELQRGDL